MLVSDKSGNVVTQTLFTDPSLTECFLNYDGKICLSDYNVYQPAAANVTGHISFVPYIKC